MIKFNAYKFLLFSLLTLLLNPMGCGPIQEVQTNQFAPLLEDVTSDSYHIIRISEHARLSKYTVDNVLDMLDAHRGRYHDNFKKERSEIPYEKQQQNNNKIVLPINMSDLDYAEASLKALPKSVVLESVLGDKGKYDLGDIPWHSEKRLLRVVDFFRMFYTDSWSPFAVLINLIPTEAEGYAKLELKLHEGTVTFRTRAKRYIWTLKPGYFWIYVDLLAFTDAHISAPMLINIFHPMDHDQANGLYLVFRKKTDVE